MICSTTYIHEYQAAGIRELAEAQGISAAAVLRAALDAHLEDHGIPIPRVRDAVLTAAQVRALEGLRKGTQRYSMNSRTIQALARKGYVSMISSTEMALTPSGDSQLQAWRS
jgi:hypothetical protein